MLGALRGGDISRYGLMAKPQLGADTMGWSQWLIRHNLDQFDNDQKRERHVAFLNKITPVSFNSNSLGKLAKKIICSQSSKF